MGIEFKPRVQVVRPPNWLLLVHTWPQNWFLFVNTAATCLQALAVAATARELCATVTASSLLMQWGCPTECSFAEQRCGSHWCGASESQHHAGLYCHCSSLLSVHPAGVLPTHQ